MASRNKVELLGYVGDTPDARFMPDGTAVTVISLATNQRWKNKAGEQKERTDWHRVIFYRGLAETVAKYVKKGAQLLVDGRIQYRDYEKDGETHYITEIIANEFQFLDKKQEEQESVEKSATTKKPRAKAAQAAEKAIDPDDIPF